MDRDLLSQLRVGDAGQYKFTAAGIEIRNEDRLEAFLRTGLGDSLRLPIDCGGHGTSPAIGLAISPISQRGPLMFRCAPPSSASCNNNLGALCLDAKGERG